MNKYKKREWTFRVISWIITFGLLIMLIIFAMGKYMNPNEAVKNDFAERFGTEAANYINKLKTVSITALISVLPMIILAMIAKDKIKPLVWAANIILSNLLFGSWMMYITFIFWAANEYVFIPICNNAKTASIAYKVMKNG